MKNINDTIRQGLLKIGAFCKAVDAFVIRWLRRLFYASLIIVTVLLLYGRHLSSVKLEQSQKEESVAVAKSSEAQAAEEQERQAHKEAFLLIKDTVIADVKTALAKEDYQKASNTAKPYIGLDVAELEELYSLATQKSQKKAEAEAHAARIKSKIHPEAVHEMIRHEGWEETYAAWGNEWMKKLNQMKHQVAEKVAASPECDRVNIVGLDSDNSIPKKKAAFFVDCENKKRFYVSNTDLESKTAVESLQAKNARISDSTAMIECRNAARRMVSHPSTFKPSVLDQSVYRAPSGNLVVTAGFKAKNSFGLELSMRARCVFDENGMGTPEISEK
jgi:multidrug efflux pump subunit AcrB